MINHIAEIVRVLPMVQEDGTMAGEGLSASATFLTFFAIPVGIFLAISGITYALTGKRKSGKEESVITHIE